MNKLQLTIGDLTPLGYKLPKSLIFRDWSNLGSNLAHMRRVTPFAMGDWLCFGEEHWAEEYTQSVENLGVDPIVMQVCIRVCQRFPYDKRHPWPCEFKHHQAVAHLPDDAAEAYLIAVRESGGMTVPELKAKLIEAGDEMATSTTRPIKKYFRLVCEWEKKPHKKFQQAIFDIVKETGGEVEVKIKE